MCGLLLFLCCQYKCWLLHMTGKEKKGVIVSHA